MLNDRRPAPSKTPRGNRQGHGNGAAGSRWALRGVFNQKVFKIFGEFNNFATVFRYHHWQTE
jgi:hypothetical protein